MNTDAVAAVWILAVAPGACYVRRSLSDSTLKIRISEVSMRETADEQDVGFKTFERDQTTTENLLPNLGHDMPKPPRSEGWKMRDDVLVMNYSDGKNK